MRVFILGAGFSKAAGIPLCNELTTDLIEHFRHIFEDDQADMLQWINGLSEQLRWFQPGGSKRINVEELFHCAAYEIEAARLMQQLQTVGREDGETPWQHGEDIKAWLAYLEEALVEVIWQRQGAADTDRLHAWAEAIRSDDCIISFNYDTLAEDVLSKQGTPWSHGFSSETANVVPVLKVHGSVDWVLMERGTFSPAAGTLLFRKENANADRDPSNRPTGAVEDDFDLVRVRDRATLEEAIENRDLNSRLFGLAGLGAYKTLHAVPGLKNVWRRACQSIFNADEIIVVGFSLSPFDGMARFHFGGAMRGREEEGRHSPAVTIVDPLASRLVTQCEHVFGSVETVEDYHENVNWESVSPGTSHR